MAQTAKAGGMVRVTATMEEWASLCFFAAQAMSCRELAGGREPIVLRQPAWRARAAKAMRVVERAARQN